jgi:AcrR family transcriptional regulator
MSTMLTLRGCPFHVNTVDMKARATYHHGDLRDALLAVAEKLVAAKGVAGFSLREAAREVGVDPAACYRHFRDKDAIVQALAQRGFARLAAGMEAAIANLRSPRAKLVALGHAYVAFAIERPASFRTMFGPTGFDARDPRLRGDYGGGRGPYQILEDTVREVDAASVDTAALILWSGVHGFASLVVDGAIRPTRSERERVLGKLLDTMVDAVTSSAGARRES